MKRMMLALGAAATLSLAAVADDPIWVDAANYGKSDLTGASRELAFGTIQDAIAAAPAGATIRVCSGVYSNGQDTAGNNITSRVAVVKDNLTLVADDKSHKPVIRGEWTSGATDVSTAIGPGALRGLAVRSGCTCRIEGFVFDHCATEVGGGDGLYNFGAAVTGLASDKTAVMIVDCEIRNCATGWGITYGASCIRTLITGCWTPTLVNSSGLIRLSDLYQCVIAHNRTYDLIGVSGTMVNCTFVDNYCYRYFRRNNCLVYNSVIKNSGSGVDSSWAVNCSIDEETPIMSTLFDDWRVLSGAVAETAGSADWLTAIGAIPADCIGYDFTGKKIAASGTICAGAVQTVTTPTYGGIYFNNRQWTVDGRQVRNVAYVYPTAYPTQYHAKATMDEGKHLVLYKIGGVNMPADTNDAIWVMPPATPGLLATSLWEQASNAYYVDPKPGMGSDDNDGSSGAPFETLQTAVTKAAKTSVIYCRSGTYEKGGGVAYGCSNRVSYASLGKLIRLKAVDGPDVTFIKGAPDPEAVGNASLPGCGSNAMRCLCAGNGQIQGFTLIDGHTTEYRSGADPAEYYRGAAVWGGENCFLTDCVVSNCVGGRWGMARCAVRRCTFSNCRVGYSMFCYPPAFCSIDATCTNELLNSTYGMLERAGYHVTLAGGPKDKPILDDCSYPLVGSIVGSGKSIASGRELHGCVLHDIATNALATGYVYADPLLVDPATDLRVLATSPAVTAGEVPTSSGWGVDYWKYASSSDLEGNPIRFIDGKPMAGAYMSLVPGVVISADNGGLAVTGGKIGVNALEGTATISLSRGATATRPCIGFTVNGVTNLFDDLTSPYVIAAESLAGGVCQVAAVYAKDWYVDAVNGSDEASRLGFTPKTAFLTLTNAMAHAVSGDTVHALPGTYRLGTAEDGKSSPTLNRVVVKDGVTLVGDEGAAETVIEGAAPTSPDAHGLGDGTVRCVSLLGTSSIRGFTLTGGRTASWEPGKYFVSYNCGGAVMGAGRAYSTVTDCVISNNVGGRAGAGRYATFVNCRITDNTGVYDSSGTCDSSQYGCLFDHNHGGSVIYGEYEVNGCTIAEDNTNLTGTGKPTDMISSPNSGGVVRNSFVCGTVINKTSSPYLDLYRSYCTGGPAAERYLDGSRAATADELALDADYRPIIGTTVGIDGASADYVAGTPLEGLADDLQGGQRVYNGARDVGALEADWRPRYAQDIRGSRVVVLSATTNVVENADRTVRINAGESLAATLTKRGSENESYVLSFTVNPGGVFTVTANGVEHVFDTAGAQTMTIDVTASETALAFSCAGGSADLGTLRGNAGLMVIVR